MFISTNDKLGKVKNVLVDFGYSAEKFANAIKKNLGCSVEVVKKVICTLSK